MELSYSRNSLDLLSKAHVDLQKIFQVVIKRTLVDITIKETERTVAKQLEYFLAGLSSIDPRDPKQLAESKHCKSPALAVDICIANPSYVYDTAHLCYVAGVVQSVAKELFEKREISHTVRWGGNWDGDTIIMYDQNLKDLPHFELI